MLPLSIRVIDGGRLRAVVCDIVMPRLNGVGSVEALADTHPPADHPVSRATRSGQLDEMGIAAPCAVLPKPFPGDRLLEEVGGVSPAWIPLALTDADAAR